MPVRSYAVLSEVDDMAYELKEINGSQYWYHRFSVTLPNGRRVQRSRYIGKRLPGDAKPPARVAEVGAAIEEQAGEGLTF